MIEYLVAIAGAYLFGSIPVGLLVGRVYRRIDIRDYGSGRTGSTNTLRTLGPGAAIIVLLLDVLKGVLPVVIAGALSEHVGVQVAAGLAVVIGHDFPIYVGFRGGRGVATSAGALGAMLPWMAPVIIASGLVLLIPFRYVSLMSIGGAPISAAVVTAFAIRGDIDPAYSFYAIAASVLIIVLHHENIGRLLAGTEPKLGQGGARRAAANRLTRPH
jgi:glycerol-3-phosphate acyltransferase PlsY